MSWKRWFLTGCLGLLAGFTNAQADRPSALLTLHSNHSVPSLQEQTWLLELQRLLQSRYYLWMAAEIVDLELDEAHKCYGMPGVTNKLRFSDTIEHGLA